MVSFSLDSVVEKNKIHSSVAFLLLLEIEVINPYTLASVQTFRVARNNEPVELGDGRTFIPFPFDIDLKYESGGIPNITLTLNDHEKIVSSIVRDYAGGVGSNVRLLVVNSANLDDPPELTEYFQVISASSQGYAMNWTLGAENALSVAFPKRRQMRDRCAWRYKGSECGYSGAMPSCDLSLTGPNGCEAHSNTVNFGGFPGIRSTNGRFR